MNTWLDEWMDGWMNGWMDGWMDGVLRQKGPQQLWVTSLSKGHFKCCLIVFKVFHLVTRSHV